MAEAESRSEARRQAVINAKEIILEARRASDEHMNNIIEADPLTYEYLDSELIQFIMLRFHLEEEDCVTDDFDELTEISLAKSMTISPELVAEFDSAKSCDGVTSTMAKKTLLYMAIQKPLGITLPPLKMAYVSSIHDISKVVWETLGHDPAE